MQIAFSQYDQLHPDIKSITATTKYELRDIITCGLLYDMYSQLKENIRNKENAYNEIMNTQALTSLGKERMDVESGTLHLFLDNELIYFHSQSLTHILRNETQALKP